MNDSEEELRGVDLLIEGDKIGLISQALKPEKAERVIDATGMVVVPGFVNTHHHFYQTLTRNVPAVQDAPLFEWLVKSYEIWRQLTLEGIELSTRTAILEMMKSGVTTISDHLYLFPEKTGKALIDAEIQLAKQMGLPLPCHPGLHVTRKKCRGSSSRRCGANRNTNRRRHGKAFS
ncbi:MAG: amidohydrolase family protein [SAR324 cluster bacterium]|nr:amidohydrolase family protein [SAR324 cluster bacterium]